MLKSTSELRPQVEFAIMFGVLEVTLVYNEVDVIGQELIRETVAERPLPTMITRKFAIFFIGLFAESQD